MVFDFAYQYQSKRKHIAISRASDYLGPSDTPK